LVDGFHFFLNAGASWFARAGVGFGWFGLEGEFEFGCGVEVVLYDRYGDVEGAGVLFLGFCNGGDYFYDGFVEGLGFVFDGWAAHR